FVELFLGDDLMKLFVRETNRYHEQQQNDFEANKNKKWTDTDIDEMKKFFALIILMGLVKKTEKNEYWSTDPLICTPIFGKVMTRHRFRQIWRYWHFSNNKNCRDRLDKVKPVTTYFQNKFQTIYKPVKELSLNGVVIPWRERLSFRTYNPDKIMKYGILVHMLCEARSGYICNFEIHCAQGIKLQETIISVLSPYLYLWHEVYTDDYYNSVALAEELLKKETNVCGTLSKNRGVPQCLKDINLNKSSTEFRRKGNILVQAFQTKKKLLYMISTMHAANMIEITHPKTKKTVRKPTCIVEYDKYMKGVDCADQYLSYYSILLKTKKWTKKVVLYFINAALFNAYQVYVKSSGNHIQFKRFLLGVANSWLNTTTETEESESVNRLCPEMRQHKIVRIIGKGRIKNPRRPCRVCTASKKRSSTSFMCSSCNVPLHAGECFEKYHTKSKY
ncbi:PiggyBac transposable element-derived protein 4, partial [Harpegnathos saltator]